MPDLVTGNAVIGQSGGPTAVINQSLVGVIEGLRAGLAASGQVKRILGMRHGVRGLIKAGDGGLVDLTDIAADRLERIAATPSAALGSTRDKPDAAYCEKILEGCRKNDIRYFFYIGGNDSADTCRIVSEKAAAAGVRAALLPRAEDHRQRSPGERPHAGLPLGRPLRGARAYGRRARQCEPGRHQDQCGDGAECGLPHRRRFAGARTGEHRRGSRPTGPRRISSICRRCRSPRTASSPTWRRSTPSSGAVRSPSAKASATPKGRRSARSSCEDRARWTPMAMCSSQARARSATGLPTSSRRG